MQLVNVDLWSFQFEYLDLQKSNCFRFLTQWPINDPNFSKKWCHMREIWFFKDDNWILPATRFHEETSPNYFSNLAPLINLKSCIPPSFWLVVQQTCKAKLICLVARTRKLSDFKSCEIYFTFSFQFIWWICLFFYAYFSYDCLF